MEKLHPGAKWLFRLRVYGSVFVILLFLIYTSFTRLSFGSTSTGTIILIALVILVVVLILIGELYARLAYSYWKYEFASNGLKIEKGIIFKTYKTIPYNRIQNVDETYLQQVEYDYFREQGLTGSFFENLNNYLSQLN